MESKHSTEPTKTPEATSPDESGSSGRPIFTASKLSGSGTPHTPAVKVNGRAGTAGVPESSGLLDRDRLLSEARITPADQAKAVRQAWDKKLALMEAQLTQYFAHEGKVTDQRSRPDNRIQLDASESLDRMLGVVAPKAEQKVQITYRLEIPEWAKPDAKVVEGEVTNVENPPSAETPDTPLGCVPDAPVER